MTQGDIALHSDVPVGEVDPNYGGYASPVENPIQGNVMMISAAAELGCVAAGMDAEKRRQAREFGDGLGLAFQLRDDILDVTGAQEVFGKPIGSDKAEGKVTLVDVKGLEQCQRDVEQYTARAKAAIAAWPDNSFLLELADHMVNRVK